MESHRCCSLSCSLCSLTHPNRGDVWNSSKKRKKKQLCGASGRVIMQGLEWINAFPRRDYPIKWIFGLLDMQDIVVSGCQWWVGGVICWSCDVVVCLCSLLKLRLSGWGENNCSRVAEGHKRSKKKKSITQPGCHHCDCKTCNVWHRRMESR